MMTGYPATTAACSPMMERVQKRVLDIFLDNATAPQTKRVVTNVHTQLVHKDAAFMIVVECFQDIQSLQEISVAFINLQCTME